METGAIATVISNCERKRSLFDSEKLERVADDRNSAHLGTRTQVTQAHKAVGDAMPQVSYRVRCCNDILTGGFTVPWLLASVRSMA